MTLRSVCREMASSTLKQAFPGAWLSIHARRLLSKPAERMARLLPHLVPRSEASLDVGANLGDYTWHLRALSSEVWAFEPNPLLADWLRRCFRETVVVRGVALGEQDMHAQLSIPTDAHGREVAGHGTIERDFGPGSRHVTVPVARLDSLELPKVGFIKIDVEGHELAVLKGGIDLLRRDRPTILVELEERHHPGAIRSASDWCGAIDYEGYFLLEEEIRPIGEFSAERHQNLSRLGDDGYVNNFIFVSREDTRRTLLNLPRRECRARSTAGK